MKIPWDYSVASQTLITSLCLRTYPFGVKLLRSEKDIPPSAERPVRDMGHRLSLCQAFGLSRRDGKTVALFKEDMWCFEPVLGLGIEPTPALFLQGVNRYPQTARTPEAASVWAKNLPRLDTSLGIKGVLTAPLSDISTDPDVILIYCNPAQLTVLLMGLNWIDGKDAEVRLSGHSACLFALVPAYVEQKYCVASPCFGDRRRAIAQDDEIIFSFPASKLQDLVGSIEALKKERVGFPIRFSMKEEYEMPQSYVDVGKLMGMYE